MTGRGYRRRLTHATALWGVALMAGTLIAGAAEDAAAQTPPGVTHLECRLHGERPYPHRHVGPDDRLIRCETPVPGVTPAVEARCLVAGFDRRGQEMPGTFFAGVREMFPDDPAAGRAGRMNGACDDALFACNEVVRRSAAYGACRVIQRLFVR